MPPKTALAIRDAQVEGYELHRQIEQAQQQEQQVQQKVQEVVRAAFAEAKLDVKDYEINTQRWVFQKRQQPPPQSQSTPAPTTPAPATPPVKEKKK